MPTSPLNINSEITKLQDLEEMFEILPSISQTGLQITMLRPVGPCGQINLENKAHCITFSDA